MKDKAPLVKFGNEWIPTHLIWKKMDAMNVALDVLDKFNNKYPHLSSNITVSTISIVKNRMKNMTFSVSEKTSNKDTILDDTLKILETNSIEDTLVILRKKKGIDVDAKGLIQFIGQDKYLQILQKDIQELTHNMISADQIAEVWNELKRPPPGGGFWTEGKVKQTLESN